MSKRYLVTGGSGFIGSALVNRLVANGDQVRVLDNESRGNARRLELLGNKIDFIQADICDLSCVRKAAQGMDSVIHLAFINGTEFFYSKPELVIEVGLRGMLNVLDACKESGVRELILASSSEVYQTPPVIPTPENVPLIVPDASNPRFSYGSTKMMNEVMAIHCGKKIFERVLIFRPHNVYGPDMGWEHVIPQFACRMKEIMKAGDDTLSFPIQGTGNETRSFIYIDDFIDGLMCMLEKGQHLNTYHIGTEEEVTIKSVAIQIASYFQKTLKFEYKDLQKGSTPRRCPDIRKIRDLGFKPGTALKEGIAKTVAWYDAHYQEGQECKLKM